MNIALLQEWVKQIEVRNQVNQDVEVINNSPMRLIGKGRQGAVFQFTDEICVKVFGNPEDCDREYYALTLGQKSDLFPKYYDKGPLHIAMDFIGGVDLREYLQSQILTPELSQKLIDMLITFKEIGYERIDHHKRQIYLQEDGSLKVIDVARTVWRDRVYPYPRKLINSLGEEHKKTFLIHVQDIAPELYKEWQYYIEMENLSREIIQKLLPDTSTDWDKKTNALLTTNDENAHLAGLEGLVHKVFKEEWIKTMLARGADPDKMIEKIDTYFDELELKRPNIQIVVKESELEKRVKEKKKSEKSRRKEKAKEPAKEPTKEPKMEKRQQRPKQQQPERNHHRNHHQSKGNHRHRH